MSVPPPPRVPWPPPPGTPPDPPQRGPSWQAIRDVCLFLGGFMAAVFEVAIAPSPRVEILVLAAAMLGLPAVFRLPPTGGDR